MAGASSHGAIHKHGAEWGCEKSTSSYISSKGHMLQNLAALLSMAVRAMAPCISPFLFWCIWAAVKLQLPA